jgi:hypothetical protein
VPDTPTSVLEAQRMERARLRNKAILQAELSTRKLILQVEQSEECIHNHSAATASINCFGSSMLYGATSGPLSLLIACLLGERALYMLVYE